MTRDLALKRARRTGPLISLVPMIDVMLILLVFFMVTSTYLNLDMIPAVRQQDSSGSTQHQNGETVLIRLGSDGIPTVNGLPHSKASLSSLLAARASQSPLTQVLVLPSGVSRTQALISVMDIATRAGISRLRVIRLEARP